ncbi:MAG: O-antigen ligase family protein [Patescibacteria group bacterium]
MTELLIISGFIMALVVFLAWPKIGLYTLALCLPAIGWSFNIRGFILPPADFIALAVLTAFLIRLIYQIFFKVSEPIKLKWPLFLPFFIFLTIGALSSLLSDNISYSLWYLIRWPLFLYFAYILVPYNLITNGRLLKKTIIALTIGSLLILISGYLSLYGQDWRDSFFRLKSIAWFGVFPFGENHNLIAEFLNVGAFLLLTLKDFTKNARTKRWCDIAFILSTLGIILTFSRTGWITLFLQTIIYIWYKSSGRFRSTAIFASLGIIIIMAPLFWKMTQLQKDNVSSTENRILLTEISLKAFQERPYLGFGSGSYINLVKENIRFTAKYGEPIDSHGMIQKVLAENGIFGLAAWLFILVYLLKTGYQAISRYRQENPWILPLTIAAAGGLFFQFFNTSYYKGKVWLPIAIFLIAVKLLKKKYQTKIEAKN